MSYRLYNNLITSNLQVLNTIKKFRKNDNKAKRKQNNMHSKKRS